MNQAGEEKMEQKIKALVEAGRREEAIGILDEYLKVHTDEAMLLMLGELLYAAGRMTDALNKFNAVVRLNPLNSKAGNYVAMISNILNYYNKDLLNP